MITFQEREPYISSGAFGPTKQKLVPVYMTKDGAEYFVANIAIAGGNYSADHNRQQMEGYKAQLIATGGRYFKFYVHTGNDDPEEMLTDIAERSHTFVKVDDMTPFCEAPEGHYGPYMIEFWGNRHEVSAAFHYRIYDREYADKLREQAQPIIDRKGRGKK
jgi:hypothetical protein